MGGGDGRSLEAGDTYQPRPTRVVTVQAGTPTTLANDTFNRTVAGAWGAAGQGGAWTLTGSTGNYSVAPGAGAVNLTTPGSTAGTAYLVASSARDVDVSTTVALDKVGAGNGATLYVLARRTSTTVQYRAKTRITSAGAVILSVTKLDGSATETVVTGGDEAWQDGAAEPTGWQRSATDSGAALQGASGPGLIGYLSSTVTNAPIRAHSRRRRRLGWRPLLRVSEHPLPVLVDGRAARPVRRPDSGEALTQRL